MDLRTCTCTCPYATFTGRYCENGNLKQYNVYENILVKLASKLFYF